MAQFGVGGMVLQGPPRPMFLSAEKQQQQQGGGFLDWLRGALDKETFTEKDPLLNKGNDGQSNGAAVSAAPKQKKGGPAPEKKGGLLGGLFGGKK